MRKSCLAAAFLVITASGCNVLDNVAKPPFSAQGVFDGSWTARVGNPERDIECVVQLILAQDVAASLPNRYRVDGTIKLNFTCTSVLEAYPEAELPAAVSINVVGFMLPDGRLLMGAVQQEDSGNIVFGLDAQGEDRTGQGFMTGLSGSFTVAANQADVPTVGFAGSLDAVHLE